MLFIHNEISDINKELENRGGNKKNDNFYLERKNFFMIKLEHLYLYNHLEQNNLVDTKIRNIKELVNLVSEEIRLIDNKLSIKEKADPDEIKLIQKQISNTSYKQIQHYKNLTEELKQPFDLKINNKLFRITHMNYLKLLKQMPQDIRKKIFIGMYDRYMDKKHDFANIYNSFLKNTVRITNKTNYTVKDFRLKTNGVSPSVFDIYLDAVKKNTSIIHKYIKHKKEQSKLKHFYNYDLYFQSFADNDINFTFNEAKELMLESFAPLGKDYQVIVKKLFKENHILVNNNQTNAYTIGSYNHLPYIIMKWSSSLKDLFTLSHEIGHAVHKVLSDANQPYNLNKYSKFLGEIVAKINESLLLKFLLESKIISPEEADKIFLSRFYGSVIRQTILADFESKLFDYAEKNTFLNADELCSLYYRLTIKYLGENIQIDDRYSIHWARVSHLFRPFYVYQYAIGFCAANTIKSNLLSSGEMVKNYIDILSSGDNVTLENALYRLGVNIMSRDYIDTSFIEFHNRFNVSKKHRKQ
jgi:oligoendopeptidase F